MAPKTSEQYEVIRESRRKQIMEVALKMFADNGYERTSISTIAREANISKGLMYNYFKSKEDLLIQLVDEGMDEMVSFFDPDRDGVLTKDEFIYFINEVFNLMQRKTHFYKLYFSLMIQPTVWNLFESKLQETIGSLLNVLTDYYRRKGSEKPEEEAILTGALLDGIGFNFIYNPDMFPLKKIKDLVIERFL